MNLNIANYKTNVVTLNQQIAVLILRGKSSLEENSQNVGFLGGPEP